MGRRKNEIERLGAIKGMEKVRVLFAMGGNMKRAGAETMIMQYLRQLVKDSRFEFSILVHGKEKGDYDDEISTLNVPIYQVPVRGQHPLSYSYAVKKVLKAHPVDIIHCNMDASCGYFLSIAKMCGIKCRIAHSHTTHYQVQKGIKKVAGIWSKKRIEKVATLRLACSEKAGNWLFGGKAFSLIKNAINLNSYYPNNEIRKKKRKELGISMDSFIIGHIGRMSYEKNHIFLLNLFSQFKKEHNDSKLILVGDGPLIDKIKAIAAQLKIEQDVLFLGLRPDVPELLQTMDCFILPSLFEGLPVSGIEAQAAGLPCLFADTITPEICMTSYAQLLPLDNISKWVKAIEEVPKERNALDAQKHLSDNGYDIEREAHRLAELYLAVYEK